MTSTTATSVLPHLNGPPGRGVVVLFAHATTNMGDNAINLGLRNLLPASVAVRWVLLPTGQANRQLVVDSLSDWDDEFVLLDDNELTADRLGRWIAAPDRFFSRIGANQDDIVILNAGEHFFVEGKTELHPRFVWRLFAGFAGVATGRRTIMAPSTLGPFDERRPETRVIRRLLEQLDWFAVRDSASAIFAKQLTRTTASVLLDPAFFVPHRKSGPLSLARRFPRWAFVPRLENFGLRMGQTLSKQTVHSFRVGDTRAAWEEFLWRESSLFRAGRASAEVWSQASSDAALAEKLVALGTDAGWALKLRDFSSEPLAIYLKAFDGIDGLVSSRFHALVLALSRGIPAVGVPLESHGHKIQGLYEMLGFPKLVCDIGASAGLHDFVSHHMYSKRERRVLRHDLAERVAELKRRTTTEFHAALLGDEEKTARVASPVPPELLTML